MPLICLLSVLLFEELFTVRGAEDMEIELVNPPCLYGAILERLYRYFQR
jgi:hypothetical protein